MEQNNKFPTEEVTLPSKGLLYPKESLLSKGVIEIKYMTAREEDILTNQNYINNGTVIDKLLQSLITTPIDYNELLIGDKNAILIAARILGYGTDYAFEYKGQEVSIDLSELKDKEIDEYLVKEGKNEFFYTLPFSKKELSFKLLNHGDDLKITNEIKGLQKVNKNANVTSTTRFKHTILSVDGNYEKVDIREFVDNQFLARDAREFRKYIKHVMPDIDLEVDITMPNGSLEEGVSMPIGIGFFWPDAGV